MNIASMWTDGRRVQEKKEKGDRITGIYNLTNVTLTDKEINILNTGFKCSMKKPINRFNVYIDIHKYVCKINMKKYFLGNKVNTAKKVENVTIGVDSGLKKQILI